MFNFILKSNFACAQWLLDKKYIDINEKSWTINCDNVGYLITSTTSANTILHVFSSNLATTFDQMSFLIKNGADPNLVNELGFTPSDYAFFARNYRIYYLLTKKNEVELQKQLVSNISSTKLPYTGCQTIESYFSNQLSMSRDDLIKLIRNLSKEDLRSTDAQGNNVLHRIITILTCQKKDIDRDDEVILYSLLEKILLSAKNNQGISVLDLAVRHPIKDFAKKIIFEGKKRQKILSFNNLMTALEKNDWPLLYTMLDSITLQGELRSGTKKDKNGNTIIHHICQRKYQPEFLQIFKRFLVPVLFEPNNEGKCLLN